MSSRIVPTLRYVDAPSMIDWLCAAFAFERGLIVDDGAGGVAHAQLHLGDGMVMIGSHRDDAFGALQSTPTALGGTTQSAYLVVDDPDAVYARVRSHGAVIVMEIRDEDYGGRGFCCRDPEGHLWNVGSYDPWATG